ncbi:M12 family metallo-peptidase [Epilithonimonas sp. JDS]|uniref:M12 family metallo-peptidase n=1 Tax=Epilithonimonas sp. JDS TaxID=2902797 RepID=UPI001E3502DC|nr:M12 family metallo-peptidase [Epilithonimonas sp. JDS]MCD9855105.1 M12 family metallo-peptidase [Epilithonimonas sp. JDS]
MKTKLHLLFAIFLGLLGFAQTLRPIAKEVNDYHSQKVTFQSLSLFTLDESSGKQASYQLAARDARVLKLNTEKLSNILKQRPEALEMTFPFEDRELTVELVKVDIYSPEFKVETNKKKVDNYKKGVFYRGIIKGDNKSVVAFSFFDNDVIGVASAHNIGNVTLGKAKNSEDFVVYNDQKLTGINPFICGVDELMENEKQKISFDPKNSKAPEVTNNCVRIYYEICNKPFIENGSSVANTVNWISAVHNNINTLYVNDGVKMSLKKVFIWETADPYTGTYDENLYMFSINRQFFDGDLAHLINYPSTTSVAYLNSLCGNYRYAYSGINITYENIPTYSWTIMAMTHEMGHSLGSPHTHSCAWNGNNTPIDWCGPTARPAIIVSEGLTCTSDVLPTNGGTIMSYCHLMPEIGINFSNGFGEQPSARIRTTVDSKSCLVQDCTNACTSGSTVFSLGDTTKNSISVNVNTALSVTDAQWSYRVLSVSGELLQSGNEAASNSFVITGLLPGTFYKIEVGTACSGSYQMSQIVLTDDDWCGKIITDSGGAIANYSDNEFWTKTFYPDSPNQKVKITIQEFNLQQSKDFLTVRNGPNADSPVFPGGNNMTGTFIRGPFESTHSTGAITLVFRSDATINTAGFKALLSCTTLGIDDVAGSRDFSLSPNPVKNQFVLNGIAKVVSVKVLDLSGKLVKEFDKASVLENIYDVSKLKSGNYLIMIKTDKDTFSKKLIKE